MRFTSGYPTQHIANVVTHRKSRVSCPYPPRPTRPETSPPHRWPTAVPDRVARPFATAENRPAAAAPANPAVNTDASTNANIQVGHPAAAVNIPRLPRA